MQKLVAFLCAVLLAACASSNADVVPSQFDYDFFRKTTGEQIAQFSSHNIEVQYELLVVGNQIVHPPAIYLIQEFAKQGVTAVPLLSDKLAQAKEEVSIRDIVAILAEMRRQKVYDVGSNPALRALVDKRVAAMNGPWKATTERMLAEMRGSRNGSQ